MKKQKKIYSVICFLFITCIAMAQDPDATDKLPPPNPQLANLVEKQENAKQKLLNAQREEHFANENRQLNAQGELAKNLTNVTKAMREQPQKEIAAAQGDPLKLKALEQKHKAQNEKLKQETNKLINARDAAAKDANTMTSIKQGIQTKKLNDNQALQLKSLANKVIDQDNRAAALETQNNKVVNSVKKQGEGIKPSRIVNDQNNKSASAKAQNDKAIKTIKKIGEANKSGSNLKPSKVKKADKGKTKKGKKSKKG